MGTVMFSLPSMNIMPVSRDRTDSREQPSELLYFDKRQAHNSSGQPRSHRVRASPLRKSPPYLLHILTIGRFLITSQGLLALGDTLSTNSDSTHARLPETDGAPKPLRVSPKDSPL